MKRTSVLCSTCALAVAAALWTSGASGGSAIDQLEQASGGKIDRLKPRGTTPRSTTPPPNPSSTYRSNKTITPPRRRQRTRAPAVNYTEAMAENLVSGLVAGLVAGLFGDGDAAARQAAIERQRRIEEARRRAEELRRRKRFAGIERARWDAEAAGSDELAQAMASDGFDTPGEGETGSLAGALSDPNVVDLSDAADDAPALLREAEEQKKSVDSKIEVPEPDWASIPKGGPLDGYLEEWKVRQEWRLHYAKEFVGDIAGGGIVGGAITAAKFVGGEVVDVWKGELKNEAIRRLSVRTGISPEDLEKMGAIRKSIISLERRVEGVVVDGRDALTGDREARKRTEQNAWGRPGADVVEELHGNPLGEAIDKAEQVRKDQTGTPGR